jgi:MoaA/NifB/PqqE/SkfB family radical SAM enzyme
LKKVGLDVVQISLDSSDEKNHDRQRNFSGAYRGAIESVNNAKKAGLTVFISTIVTGDNLLNGEMIKLAHMAKSADAILHLNTACSSGRWGEKKFNFDNEVKSKLNLLLKLPHVRINTEAAYFTMGCKAGLEKIYITAYGDVTPCPFIQISFGNIKDKTIKQMWEEMRKVPYFNGKSKECLTSQNQQFISEYLEPLGAAEQLPYSYELLKDIKR